MKEGQNKKPAKATALEQQYALEEKELNTRFCISCLVLTSIVWVLGSVVNGSESTW
jgi:ribosomal protein S26